MYRREIAHVEVCFDATECELFVDADAVSARLSLQELDDLIETLKQARREADPSLWEAK